jgi:hypothetical protein
MFISSGNELYTEIMPKVAELWAIHQGIQLALSHGFSNYWTKSDSLAAINFIQQGCSATHPRHG